MRHEAAFQPEFREDLRHWVESDRKLALRVLGLVVAELRDPFVGIGEPEPLRYLGSDVWAQRITREHRLVYQSTSAHRHAQLWNAADLATVLGVNPNTARRYLDLLTDALVVR